MCSTEVATVGGINLIRTTGHNRHCCPASNASVQASGGGVLPRLLEIVATVDAWPGEASHASNDLYLVDRTWLRQLWQPSKSGMWTNRPTGACCPAVSEHGTPTECKGLRQPSELAPIRMQLNQ